jgi:hypothetical protein
VPVGKFAFAGQIADGAGAVVDNLDAEIARFRQQPLPEKDVIFVVVGQQNGFKRFHGGRLRRGTA